MCARKSIDTENFSAKDLVFGKPKEGELRDGTSFKKIPISVLRSDGSVGPLIIVAETCFSFGIQRDDKYGTFTIPLVLYDKGGPTPKQKLFAKTIREIISACEHRPKSCLYGREESPIMYLKLGYDKERKEFETIFRERDDMGDKESTKSVKPEKYIGKYCLAKVAVKVDSVFVANTTTLQIKAHTVILSETKRRGTVDDDFLNEM